MRIKVIDAFGTELADCIVVWHKVAARKHLSEEVRTIFPPSTTVVLPTNNERAPWRLEVEP